MQFQDVFRAQYFISKLQSEINNAIERLGGNNFFKESIEKILLHFSSELLIELDQHILPSIAFEINKAKLKGQLIGKTAEERYKSFFVDEKKFTSNAQIFLKKYPFLIELLDELIEQTYCSLFEFVQRFHRDFSEICKKFNLSSNIKIKNISPLFGADRHCKKQGVLITFETGKKIIYKPVDLSPEILYFEFIQFLSLQYPYDQKCPNVLPMLNYGWIEYIDYIPCQNKLEVELFYKRFGVLLAIADALNYTDGHHENLIASGPYPILIDCETLFQNYEIPVISQKNILSTQLIQKNVKKSTPIYSALQASSELKIECLQTHALNDRTDEILIRYRGIRSSKCHHRPTLYNAECCPVEHKNQIVEGYRFAYHYISSNINMILNHDSWWTNITLAKSRIVIRETMTYLYLIRKIQQPQRMTSKEKARKFLSKKLSSTPYSDYEIDDLLSLNIPYFYQIPGKRHLYDGRGYEYKNVFSKTAIEILRDLFLERSETKLDFDCKIISKNLVKS
jgi:type 2 lantibiotic biosynthesis protein LanM